MKKKYFVSSVVLMFALSFVTFAEAQPQNGTSYTSTISNITITPNGEKTSHTKEERGIWLNGSRYWTSYTSSRSYERPPTQPPCTNNS
jgi:hypothetical protein